jgi:hypothetical protein
MKNASSLGACGEPGSELAVTRTFRARRAGTAG